MMADITRWVVSTVALNEVGSHGAGVPTKNVANAPTIYKPDNQETA